VSDGWALVRTWHLSRPLALLRSSQIGFSLTLFRTPPTHPFSPVVPVDLGHRYLKSPCDPFCMLPMEPTASLSCSSSFHLRPYQLKLSLACFRSLSFSLFSASLSSTTLHLHLDSEGNGNSWGVIARAKSKRLWEGPSGRRREERGSRWFVFLYSAGS